MFQICQLEHLFVEDEGIHIDSIYSQLVQTGNEVPGGCNGDWFSSQHLDM